MKIQVAISEDSLKNCQYALCNSWREEVVRFKQPDGKSFSGWRRICKLNSDLQYFKFINHSDPLPTEATQECWACAFRSLAGSAVKDIAQSRVLLTKNDEYEFLGFLSQQDFLREAEIQASDRISAWEALYMRLRPGYVSFESCHTKEICAFCVVKDIRWSDCEPALIKDDKILLFQAGLKLLVLALQEKAAISEKMPKHQDKPYESGKRIEKPKATTTQAVLERCAVQTMPSSLEEFQEVLNYYNLEREATAYALAQELFRVLILRDEEFAFTTDELNFLIPKLDKILIFTNQLILDWEGEDKKVMLEFRQMFEVYLRNLKMAHFFNLKLWISY